MRNEIPEEYIANVVERPDAVSLGGSSKYNLLLAALKNMDRTKALSFSKNEFAEKFGKFGKNSIRLVAKKANMVIKFATIKETTYVWAKELTNKI